MRSMSGPEIIGGRIVRMRLPSMVLPARGAPQRSMWWTVHSRRSCLGFHIKLAIAIDRFGFHISRLNLYTRSICLRGHHANDFSVFDVESGLLTRKRCVAA